MSGDSSESNRGLPVGGGLLVVLAVTASLMGAGVLFARVALPVMPIAGSSLEPSPTTRSGELPTTAAAGPPPEYVLAVAHAVAAPGVRPGAEPPGEGLSRGDPQVEPGPATEAPA